MRFSALRRIRVARWSTRNRSSSSSASFSRRSIASSRVELAVHQRLGAAGQAEEDVADVAAQLGLLDGDPDRGLLDGVERLADLADLVVAELQRRRLGARRRPPRRARAAPPRGAAARWRARQAALRSRSSWRTSARAVVIDTTIEAMTASRPRPPASDQPDDDADGDRSGPPDDARRRRPGPPPATSPARARPRPATARRRPAARPACRTAPDELSSMARRRVNASLAVRPLVAARSASGSRPRPARQRNRCAPTTCANRAVSALAHPARRQSARRAARPPGRAAPVPGSARSTVGSSLAISLSSSVAIES